MPVTVAWQSRAPQPPAYNAVPARTTLADFSRPIHRTPPPPPLSHRPLSESPSQEASVQTPKTTEKVKVAWTDASKQYVARAIASLDDGLPAGITKADCAAKLKSTMNYFGERNSLHTVDWPNYPLPQVLLLGERMGTSSNPTESISNYVIPSSDSTNNQPLASSSKRKSQDMDGLQPSSSPAKISIPPWQKTNSLVDRISFANGQKDKRTKKNASAADSPSKFDSTDLEKRKQRFQLGAAVSKTTPPWKSSRNDSDSEESDAPIVGTNQSLEKSYLRLTSRPKAESVRPQHVLEKTLDMLRQKWKSEEKNYNYICNQFKSLRQDLTVQHIKNPFTVRVYETHARIALEKEDLGEYNQCQTQLRALYEQNLGGHPAEFLAYRILYFVYTCNKADMNDLLAELTPADKTQDAVKHALAVRSSLALGNYHKFFKLYLEAPNMGPYLMDMFVARERLSALANISKAYMSISLRFLTDELGFMNADECRAFFETYNVQHLIEEKVDEKTGKQSRVNMKGSAALFDKLRANAFSKIDIKGQI